MSSGTGWRGFHLFLARWSDGDEVLTALGNILRDRAEDDARWFFIRYGIGGPHLRIRFDDASPNVSSIVGRIAAINRELVWRARRESGSVDLPASAGEVVETEYIPETVRYGGKRATALNESVFHQSSRLALACLERLRDRPEREKCAIDMLVAGVASLPLSDLSPQEIFLRYANTWARWLGRGGGGRPHEGRESIVVRQNIPKRFGIYSDFLTSSVPARTPGQHWVRLLSESWRGHADLHRAGALVSPSTGTAAVTAHDFEEAVVDILFSQAHMFNNRLGISIAKECDWNYLLSKHWN